MITIKIDTVFVKRRADGEFEMYTTSDSHPHRPAVQHARGWLFKIGPSDLSREDSDAIKQLLETSFTRQYPLWPIKSPQDQTWLRRSLDGTWTFSES